MTLFSLACDFSSLMLYGTHKFLFLYSPQRTTIVISHVWFFYILMIISITNRTSCLWIHLSYNLFVLSCAWSFAAWCWSHIKSCITWHRCNNLLRRLKSLFAVLVNSSNTRPSSISWLQNWFSFCVIKLVFKPI